MATHIGFARRDGSLCRKGSFRVREEARDRDHYDVAVKCMKHCLRLPGCLRKSDCNFERGDIGILIVMFCGYVYDFWEHRET